MRRAAGSWDEYVHLAFDEICLVGAGSPVPANNQLRWAGGGRLPSGFVTSGETGHLSG